MRQDMDSIFKQPGKHYQALTRVGFGKDFFAEDPFFSKGCGNPFERMDKMMSQMRSGMMKPIEFDSFAQGPGQRFSQQTMVSSTKMHNGRAIEEKYATKANGAIGTDGKRLVERHQMYENTGTGLQKVANERMLNDRGRKVVKERLGGTGGPTNNFDHYRNIRQEEASAFD